MATLYGTTVDENDIRPIRNIVKLVTSRNISELNSNDIQYALSFYYNCISSMKAGNIICPVAAK